MLFGIHEFLQIEILVLKRVSQLVRQNQGLHFGRSMTAAQDHLECHEPIEADLPGLVHNTHASAAQFAQDVIPLGLLVDRGIETGRTDRLR